MSHHDTVNPMYSLTNPPQAPKKAPTPLWRPWALVGLPKCPNFDETDEEERQELQLQEEALMLEATREVYESWHVRPKFLRWTPDEVANIDTPETCAILYKEYTGPKSHPKNRDEIVYLTLMTDALLSRICDLKIEQL